MKKETSKLLSTLAAFAIIIFTASCGGNEQTASDTSNIEHNIVQLKDEEEVVSDATNKSYNFEQVGYYKGDNKLRYFTFYVNSPETIKESAIPKDFLDAVREHGSEQTNTSGQITASFYYLDKNSTPDISTLSATKANDLAHNKKPIAAVWIMPNGQVNVIEKPE
jgi:hypothetical protein